MSEKIISVKTFLMSLALMVLFLSCASGPLIFKSAPDWVYTAPENTEEAVYFVSSGSDASGNSTAAEEKAKNALVQEVIRTIGVKITSETTAEAREAFENFEAEIRGSIYADPAEGQSEFQVVDTWTDRRESQVVLVYMLGTYSSNLLLKEQKRIRALFEESVNDTTDLEKEGDHLFKQGENYTAAVKYLDAAASVLNSGEENRYEGFSRIMEKARAAIKPIGLEKINDNLTTVVDKPFIGGFRLAVSGAGNSRIGIYYTGDVEGTAAELAVDEIQPDSTGLAVFTPGIPRSAGPGTVSMFLDFRSSLEILERVPKELKGEVKDFKDLAAGKNAAFAFRVYSRAKDVPTGIMILDVDMAGNPRASRDTASGVMESLTLAQFTIVPVPERFQHNKMEDGEIIAKAKLLYGNYMERIIFGIIQIVDFGEDEGNYLIEVQGSLAVADLVSGRVILRESSSKRSRGSNTVSVISAAFKSIGLELGQVLASKLQ